MMALLMLSAGMLTALAAKMAVRRRGFMSGSPPLRAAIEISLMMRVKLFPRFASMAAFLCLIVAHFEWPDIWEPQESPVSQPGGRCNIFKLCGDQIAAFMSGYAAVIPLGARVLI